MEDGEVQFQIMSDLHLETPQARPSYSEFKIQPQCRYLALLGDIGSVLDPQLFTFLEEQLQAFETVLFLLGNHEPYGTSLPAAQSIMRTFQYDVGLRSASTTTGRFIFLDRTRFDLTDSVTILGCTLFSSITPEQGDTVTRFVSDFSNIEDWTIETHCAAHRQDLEWLNAQVAQITNEEPYRSILIFTHYSPTALRSANDPKHIEDTTQIHSAFVTNLSDEMCWASPQVKLWAFGHTHFNCDFEDPQTGRRILTNQKGYRRTELVTFSPTKVVSVDTSFSARNKSLNGESWLKESKRRIKRCVIV